MNKLKFVFSGISFFIGLITWLFILILKKIIPILGYMAFQTAASGSYNPMNYSVSLNNVYIISSVLMLSGFIGMIVFSLIDDKCSK